MLAYSYSYSYNSTNEYGIVLVPQPVALREKIKGGILAQGIVRASGENDVSHIGFSFDAEPCIDPLSLLPGKAKARHCDRRLLTDLYNGSRVTIPIACYPGYSHNYEYSETTQYATTNFQIAASCEGPTGSVTRVIVTDYVDGRWTIETIRQRFSLRPFASRYKMYVSTASAKLSLASDGHVLLEYDRPFGPDIEQTSAVAVMIPFLDNNSEYTNEVQLSMKAVFQTYTGKRPFDVSELLQQASNVAYNGMKKTSVNTVMYFTDLSTILSTVQSLASTVSNPLSPKAWSSAYLGWKWGIKSQISDTYKAMDDLQKRYSAVRNGNLRTRGSASTLFANDFGVVSVTGHVKIFYSPKPGWARGMIRSGLEWNIWPSFKTTVDFIPFSFICNWFSNFSEVLTQIDNSIYVEYQDVKGSLNSIKQVIDVPLSRLVPGLLSSSKVRFTRYERWYSDSAYAPRVPSLDLDRPSAINAVDGGSLLMQRFGK